MNGYKLVPVDTVRRAASILGSQGFDVWDQLASELDGILTAPDVQGEPVCPTCPTCYGRGWDMDCQNEFRPATCPDCAGSGKAEHSITVQESDSATPDVSDYEQVLDDHRRLTRELDVLLNGEEGAAQQASLCDLVAQLRTVVKDTGKPVLAAPDVARLVDALEDVVSEIESNTCPHDNTYRGGAIWEICEDCGGKWADDMGGKPEFAWPESVETARNLIHAYRKQGDGK